MKKFNRAKANLFVVTISCVVVLAFTIALNCVAVYWGGALEVALGYFGGTPSSFKSNYSDEDLLKKERDTSVKITEEGTVLLKNNEALPLENGKKITLLGAASISRGGESTGSSGGAESEFTLKNVLEQGGLSVNPTVWDWYGKNTEESDWTKVQNANYSSFAQYNDAAIVVIYRNGGESRDIAKIMTGEGWDEGQPYTRINAYERSLIKGAKSAGFKKVIVLVRSVYPLETDFLDDADGVLVCSSTGHYGLYGLGNVITGKANPSGHLVDTWVYDSFSAPAMQNFGDNRYIWQDKVSSKFYSYVNYAESIYVGYKYYETRYEDKVNGVANIGNFDYSTEVAYPFGYGLSYTKFSYDNFDMTEKDGKITVTVTVTNEGSVEGMDAVQVYFQSPYTEYDKANKVEKSAVSLAAFKKTGLIAAGGKETVTLTFDVDDMKSYDYVNAKTYIMDNGNYYITVAEDAHAAVNNILAANGVQTDKLTSAGGASLSANASLVKTYVEGGTSPRKIDKDDVTGNTVKNQFDYAIAEGGTYLSRSNWSVMDDYNPATLTGGISYSTGNATVESSGPYNTDLKVGTREISASVRASISANGWNSTGRPASADDKTEAKLEQPSKLKLVDLVKADYDDNRWQSLVEQMSVADLHGLFNRAGYQTAAVDSVEKPATTDVDGPTGLTNYVTNWTSFQWPNQTLLASTWNVELARTMGDLVAEDALRTGVSCWYAPGVNMHRTPFGGRTPDYYSEDSLLSGYMAAYETMGAQNKGLAVYLKHFAMNEQETNRGAVSTWATEQTIREIYLRPFEIAVKVGNALGVMDAQNRIGFRLAKGNYELLTAVLRNEWGFKGAVVTDATSDGGEYSDACLSAGTDLMLTNTALRLTSTKSNEVRHALQDAAKHVLYMVSRTNAMNALLKGAKYSSGFPKYIVLLIAIDVVAAVGIALGEFFVVKGYAKKRKTDELMEA